MIEIKNVSKRLGDKDILKNLNLNIKNGSIFGLVGINGAGKSTLLRCISDVYKLDEGEILINGENIRDNFKLKKELLFISDDCYCPLNATLNSLKEFYKVYYNFSEEKFAYYLKFFKLPLNKNINNFSKGMKRQVFILMALSIRPKILLLDETFDGLDPLIRLRFKRALYEMIENGESTIIISSHNLKELEDICDSFGILDNKNIKTSGDLQSQKEKINKYQIVFNEEKNKEDFKDFNVIKFDKNSRVINMIIRGEKEDILLKLNEMEPLLVEIVPINFEELFISELESENIQ